MDIVINKLSVRFSVPEEEQQELRKDSRISQQRSSWFKGADKKTSWFPRLRPAGMADTSFSADGSFEVAVAASAYAINSRQQREMVMTGAAPQGLQRLPSKKARAHKDDASRKKPSNVGRICRYFSIKEEAKDEDEELKEATGKITKMPSVTKHPVAERKPSLQKTLTLPKPESKTPEPDPKKQPSIKPLVEAPNEISSTQRTQTGTSKPKINGKVLKVTAWENAQREKIKKRYNKANATILEWENAKKVKAKRKLENKEKKLEVKRATVLQEYRMDLRRIDRVSSRAKAKAEDRRRNEEAKLRAKVKEIQSIGKTPKTILCF